jgi:TonB family protein
MPCRISREFGCFLFLWLVPWLCRAQRVPEEIRSIAYPRVARAAGSTGVVVVEFNIGSDGEVLAATALAGPPILSAAVLPVARQWRFAASATNGSAFRAEFEFKLEGNCKTQCCGERFVVHLPNHVTVTAETPSIRPSAAR